jgi:hypothetical protein
MGIPALAAPRRALMTSGNWCSSHFLRLTIIADRQNVTLESVFASK